MSVNMLVTESGREARERRQMAHKMNWVAGCLKTDTVQTGLFGCDWGRCHASLVQHKLSTAKEQRATQNTQILLIIMTSFFFKWQKYLDLCRKYNLHAE